MQKAADKSQKIEFMSIYYVSHWWWS